MASATATPDTLPAWQTLSQHAQALKHVHLKNLFGDDPGRWQHFTRQVAGLTLDLSKQRWDDDTLEHLLALAQEAGVPGAIEALLEHALLLIILLTVAAMAVYLADRRRGHLAAA